MGGILKKQLKANVVDNKQPSLKEINLYMQKNNTTSADMKNWKQHIPRHFSSKSSVWVYQSSPSFTKEQVKNIQENIDSFTNSWLSHKQPVQAWGAVLFNRFIILMADETLVQVSGCAKDSMMHFIQSIQKQYTVDLLTRTQLAFIKNNTIEILPIDILAKKIASAEIDERTLYFNNTISNKHQLLHEWIIEVQHSWLKQKYSTFQTTVPTP